MPHRCPFITVMPPRCPFITVMPPIFGKSFPTSSQYTILWQAQFVRALSDWKCPVTAFSETQWIRLVGWNLTGSPSRFTWVRLRTRRLRRLGAIIWRVEGRYLSRWVISDQLLGAIIWRVEGRYLSRWVISAVLLGAIIWSVEGRYLSRWVLSDQLLGAIIWRVEGRYLSGWVKSAEWLGL